MLTTRQTRLVDLSLPIRNASFDTQEQHIEYTDHREVARGRAKAYGISLDDLPLPGVHSAMERVTLSTHAGTHVDAPMHFVSAGASIDKLSLEPFIGPARVVDIPDNVQAIDAPELGRHNWKGAARILFRTRSARRGWMSSPTFHHDFAYIAPDAAQLLADAGVRLVGIDYISAEQFGARAPLSHRILLGKGIPIVEGLALETVGAGDYDLIVLPIKVAGHEGAPARAALRRRAP